MAEIWLKYVNGVQSVAGQNAMGVDHPLGLGAPAVMSDGMELRGKNQTWIPDEDQSTVKVKMD
jgi:hypothetical protein